MRKRPKTSPKLALRIARAQLRITREVIKGFDGQWDLKSVTVPTPIDGTEPPRFIQCWAVSGRPVTQALDSSGQVWERVWHKGTATTPEESWWEPIDMTRKAPKENAK